MMYTVLILPIICILSSYAFVGPVNNHQHKITLTSHYDTHHIHQLYIATRDDQDASSTRIDQLNGLEDLSSSTLDIKLQAYISSGIECKSDLSTVLQTIKSVCEEEYGLPIDVTNLRCNEQSAIVDSIPGVLGRVLVINVCGIPPSVDIDENELIIQLKNDLSQRIDAILQSDDVSNHQPILLAFQSSTDSNITNSATTEEEHHSIISEIIEQEISDYALREELNEICNIPTEDVDLDSLLTTSNGCFVHPYEIEINCYPTMVIDIDGDMVSSSIHGVKEDDGAQDVHFDTSSVLVFDKLLDKKLRKRLLNVVKGYPEDHTSKEDDWDDNVNGPDLNRWERGRLLDIVVNDNSDNKVEEEGSCWGLADDAIMDICYNEHPAIAEFESKLSLLFPDFIVARLPQAVLGECVSPLTANAPTHGDKFDYHIDADPLQAPASPYTDVFGRYPNRMKGKPRFVSCLVYLNDEWNGEEWGAPTRFLDPPTNESIEVLPKPGRVVIMDQDISHTVVAPNAKAGKRPRYSLVWKLILHPREAGQDMSLCCGRGSMWPEPIAIGSANKN